jgi:hypothetical protein
VVYVGDSLTQNLVGEGSSVAFAEKQEAEHVGHRVAILPLEVDVGHAAGHVFHVNEEGGDGVRHNGTARVKNAVVAYAFALHGEMFGEFGRIGAFDFEEDDLLVQGKSMLRADQVVDALEVFRGAGPGAPGYEADRLVPNGAQEVGRVGGEFNARDPQFGGAGGARYEGDEKDGEDEKAGDFEAFGALPDVHECGVDEDKGDKEEGEAGSGVPDGEGDGAGGRGDDNQNAGGVCAALGIDVGVKADGYEKGDAHEDKDKGPCGAGPIRGPFRSAAGNGESG